MSKEQVMNAILELTLEEQEEIRSRLDNRLNNAPISTMNEQQMLAEVERRFQDYLANPYRGMKLEELEVLRQQRKAARRA